jgi:hypothetical protein
MGKPDRVVIAVIFVSKDEGSITGVKGNGSVLIIK